MQITSGTLEVALTALIQLLMVTAIITRIKVKADILERSHNELKEGQAELQTAVTKLVQALSDREVVEGRYDERIRHVEEEVESLRRWRNNAEMKIIGLVAQKLGINTGLGDLLRES